MRRRAASRASQVDWLSDAVLWAPPSAEQRLRSALDIERIPIHAMYRPDEAQRLLRISVKSIYRHIEEGALSCITPRYRGDNSFVRIEYMALLAWFDQDAATVPTQDERLRFALDLERLSVRGLYRIDEAGRLLRISEMSVRRLIDSGDLMPVQAHPGAAIRIDYLSLRGLFEARP